MFQSCNIFERSMSFSKKAAEIMHTLQTDYGDFRVPVSKKELRAPQKPCKHSCSAVEVKLTPLPASKSPSREALYLQTPVIIERKTRNPPHTAHTSHARSASAQRTLKTTSLKKVQPFVPIAVPTRDRNKLKLQSTMETSRSRNKEIEIVLEGEGDQECLKKLFRKVHALTAELAESERERVRMGLELAHLSKRDLACQDHEKTISRLEGEKYRLEVENEALKKAAGRAPKETVKEVVVERPIQVKVEVPKYIPGPERVVEKIIQVPKYIEIEKKIPEVIVKEIKVPEIVQRPVYVDKPVYHDPIIVDKPVFVDKPVYVDRPVEVEKKVEVPVQVQVEVPVYVDRPVVDEEWLRRFQELEEELGGMMRENQTLKGENHGLRTTVGKLQASLEVLSQHNREKNREIEVLLGNRGDYLPPREQHRERKYSALDRTSSTLSPRSHLRYL